MSDDQFQPRYIRASRAHLYLAMNRNQFAQEVRPYLPTIELSTQGRAYDRLDLDRFADDYKRRNGRPPQRSLNGVTLWEEGKSRPGSSAAVKPGTSTSRSRATADFAKALATVTLKTQ